MDGQSGALLPQALPPATREQHSPAQHLSFSPSGCPLQRQQQKQPWGPVSTVRRKRRQPTLSLSGRCHLQDSRLGSHDGKRVCDATGTIDAVHMQFYISRSCLSKKSHQSTGLHNICHKSNHMSLLTQGMFGWLRRAQSGSQAAQESLVQVLRRTHNAAGLAQPSAAAPPSRKRGPWTTIFTPAWQAQDLSAEPQRCHVPAATHHVRQPTLDTAGGVLSASCRHQPHQLSGGHSTAAPRQFRRGMTDADFADRLGIRAAALTGSCPLERAASTTPSTLLFVLFLCLHPAIDSRR